MKKLRGFAVSWFFAPYMGSADLDFFKRIKDTHIDYDVMQVKRGPRDDRVLQFASAAGINRIEVTTDHANPRTRRSRDDFERASLARFEQSPGTYDFLISHSNEVPSHAVALKIKKAHPRLPWIAYFGDLVSRNPYVRHLRHYPLSKEDNATEAATLAQADAVILNNEYQRDLMFDGASSHFAHKAEVIPHCYDPAMYPASAPARGDRYVFTHLGSLYSVKRTAEPVLRAVDRMLEIYPGYENRFEVVFYGSAPGAQDVSAYENMKNPSHVRFEPAVGYLQSLELMSRSHALLLLDGIFDEQTDGLEVNPFFAGKLADYMGARRPIMSVTMPKGPSADLLRQSANLIADTRTDRIAYVMKRYIDGKVNVDYSVYDRFTCASIGAQMERSIRRVVESTYNDA